MAQLGSSDGRSGERSENNAGIMDQVSETAQDLGARAVGLAGEFATAIRERPYTALAMAAGFAFAVGALWKIGHRRPTSRWDALTAHMQGLPSGQKLLGRHWS